MIADSLIDIVNWVIQHFIFPLFPNNFPFFSFETYDNLLEGLKTNVVFTFSVIDRFFPITLLLTLLITILIAEIVLFGIKAGMWFLNLIRGSGA